VAADPHPESLASDRGSELAPANLTVLRPTVWATMMGDSDPVQPLRELESRADLGLPVPQTRFPSLKRAATSLSRLSLHRKGSPSGAVHAWSRRSEGRGAPTLSVCCLTNDAGPAVAALLGQLRPVADEIFVAVDSTTEATALGLLAEVADRLIRYEFAPPFERALAWAHAQCSGDWVLRIDSDEVAAPSLIGALPELIRAKDVLEYHIPRRWLYPDTAQWLDEFPWSMDYQARLVRNDPATLWFEGVVHSNTGCARPARYLEYPLYHLACATSSAEDRTAKVARYVAEDVRPEGSLAIHRANYAPERYATREPRPVPAEDRAAIAGVLEAAGDRRRSPSAPAHPVPVARRSDIDRHWDRRAVAPDAHRASLEVVEGDTRMHAGQNRDVHVRVTNLGSETWPGGLRHPVILVSYHWLDPEGHVVVADGVRSPFPAAVPPGTSCVLPVTVIAPDEPGRYVLEIDIVHEQVCWFGCGVREEMTLTKNPPRWFTDDSPPSSGYGRPTDPRPHHQTD